jgi:hypothetical protein
LLSRDVKVKIHISSILPVLYGYEAWSLTLREERRLRVFENRRIFGSQRDEVAGEQKKLNSEELLIFKYPQISLGRSNQRELGMTCCMREREKCTAFCWESPKERDHSVD